MNIAINENLKELRKQKGNTQEELAEHLGISMQAVSKWERGESYPDITLIPALTLYYNVTSDQLLGIDSMNIDAKVQEYLKKDRELWKQDNSSDDDRTAIWREAHKEFPNNHTVLFNLINSLWWKIDEDESYNEIVKIGERLLRESTDNKIRFDTIAFLCGNCYIRRGDFETAKKYAEMAPNHWNSKEELYSKCLKGEEAVIHNQSSIRSYVMSICVFAARNAFLTNELTEKIKIYEFILNLYKLIYPDGEFVYEFKAFHALYNLVCCNLSLGNTDKALSYLIEMPEYFVKMYTNSGFDHTSFMVNRLTGYSYKMPKAHMLNEVSHTIQENFENNKDFDCIRNDERYKSAIEKMKTLLQ